MEKLQIVYVVTFGDSNYYFEQALLSICSARMHNPEATIRIVTDAVSGRQINGWRKRVLDEYRCEVVEAQVPDEFNKVERSRYLKTSLRLLLKGDFLFVDTDTIICRPLDGVAETEGDICAVLDRHVRWHENSYMIFADARAKLAGIEIAQGDAYFNSGVMYVRDTTAARNFYESWSAMWHKTLEKGFHYDQIAMFQADAHCRHIIREINGKWNCQLGGLFINYLHDAYIIHYYASSNVDRYKLYKFKYEETYQEVRTNEGITPQLREALLHPYEQFYDHYLILNGWTLDLYDTCLPCIELCNESPRRFALIDKLAKWLRKSYKK